MLLIIEDQGQIKEISYLIRGTMLFSIIATNPITLLSFAEARMQTRRLQKITIRMQIQMRREKKKLKRSDSR